MKELLDSLRGKKIWVFLESGSVTINVSGTLVGGDLPGRPYGVHVELQDGTFDDPQANVAFKPESVTKHNYTNGIHCFKLQ